MLQCTCIDMHEYLYLIEVYTDLVKAPVFYATYYCSLRRLRHTTEYVHMFVKKDTKVRPGKGEVTGRSG